MSRGENPRIRLVALALLLTLVSIRGQEPDPMDPTYIRFGVDRADVIVIGAFKVARFYPWVDGWHYSGVLDTDEVLLGDGPGRRTLPFSWLETYENDCRICERMSQFDHKSGIWILTTTNGGFRLTGTAATLCGGPLPLEALDRIKDAIGRKRTRN